MNHAGLVYAFPIWILATWTLLLVLSGLCVSIKRHLARLSDRLDECVGKQDVYFRGATVETEIIRSTTRVEAPPETPETEELT